MLRWARVLVGNILKIVVNVNEEECVSPRIRMEHLKSGGNKLPAIPEVIEKLKIRVSERCLRHSDMGTHCQKNCK